MICPNDNTEMRQVKTVGHYGGPIIIDQCEKCGGIWFDEAELFRAKQGEAEKIEMWDTEILRTPSTIENSILFCHRDKAAMHRFTDKYFPEDIVLARCPSCHGFWLNRGVFTKYQQFRQELMPPKKTSPQDEKLKKTIGYLVKSCESGRSPEALRRLGEFLSTSIGRTEKSDYSANVLNNPVVATAEDIADFLATILTKLLMPR
jgi:Zn-finger nucleic acid-binding protein